MNNKLHYSVLLNETISQLKIKPNGIYVDLTLGMGGHSEAILKKLSNGKLYCFDKDDFALKYAKNRLSQAGSNFELIKSDFQNIKSQLAQRGIAAVDGIIADLGISSPQVDNSERGFSYNKNAKLDMRMDTSQALSAWNVVNQYSEQQLAQILWDYADVKLSKRVAKAIVENRPIETTLELVDVIKQAYPAKLIREKNPSKAIFQAIRIEVNNELESLKQMLIDAIDLLKHDSVLAIITFHSIEDKIVKNFFKNLIQDKTPAKLPIIIQKDYIAKQIYPSNEEIQQNKRSRSAKLRVLYKK
ncbi:MULTISPECIES: 16S rRNA (cytosine(1402)-N(4))-methyltransferase RsmH [unclassified Mycoplasma]|uniref:16S rRNA (cytosine(1402)-N(4))-methyltransferase RsmH n=1 Tax=unclassified Mycoplasma TaxID=2683645 RepID=UPI00211D0FCC|nr:MULTISPECIES: 16S rRNA (cytosine(1402)-N(4))-methyltransferase RsmH [unclassified Mycoplasma]UUM20124.1 16S rRNA (cytosine(1402)-N(4))-methyltransferase RsmH [Mycoplasma sp. 1578d]UUM25104.1 16S rRNA (cytosine(1402)-N(4))-methyltransferase RsmH [Mycoplasma sp. 3686d]